MNPLSRKAMLVRLSIHSWRGRKIDRAAATAAAKALNIKAEGDEYYKYLVPKKAFAGIIGLHSTIRLYHADMTFPWFDDGIRVLPSAKFFEYMKQIHGFRDTQDRIVDHFLQSYDQYKEYARANRQAMFSEKDYPSKDELRESFSVELSFLPFPEANDFRVDLAPEVLEELKGQIVNEQTRVIEQHREEMLFRLQAKLQRLDDMCAHPNPRIYDATLETFKESVEIAESLNIMDDLTIKAVVTACKTWLTSVDPETLRNSPETRQRVVAAVQEILEIMKDGS